MELEIFDEGNSFDQSSDYKKLTASISSFSKLLSDSQFKGTSSYDKILQWLHSANLKDEHGFKAEFKRMVEKAESLFSHFLKFRICEIFPLRRFPASFPVKEWISFYPLICIGYLDDLIKVHNIFCEALWANPFRS